MKFTFDLFNGSQTPSNDFKAWIPGWWYRSEGIPARTGRTPNGDAWLLAGFLLSDEDPNAILARTEAEGVEALFKADGQFLWAVHSRADDRVVIHRDRTGVLPIEYAQGERGFVLSVWTENVTALSGVAPRVSRGLFDELPVYRVKLAPDTPLENVKSLSARHSLQVANGVLSTREYPTLSPAGPPFDSLISAGDSLGGILSAAVQKRVAGAKSVGAWLSGGNDSSLLVALAREHHRGEIKTVFMTFDDYQMNYGKYARDVAKQFETDHAEICVGLKNYLNHWAETIRIMGHPLPSPGANIAQVVALKQLSLPVDVLLVGEGADTVFGGPYWAPFLFLSSLGGVLPGFLRNSVRRAPSHLKGKGFLFKALQKGAKALGTPFLDYLHSEIACGNEETVDRIFGSGVWRRSADSFKSRMTGDPFDSLFLYLMLDWLPLWNAGLRRIAHHHGAVYVFPFLDYELMRNSMRLPRHLRFHYSTKKATLKKYALKYFDKEFIHKPKEGFGVPLGQWLSRSEFAPFLNLPLEERSLRRGWWKESDLKPIIDSHKAGRGDDNTAESIPWITMNLELWARICLEGDSPDLYRVG